MITISDAVDVAINVIYGTMYHKQASEKQRAHYEKKVHNVLDAIKKGEPIEESAIAITIQAIEHLIEKDSIGYIHHEQNETNG